MDRYAKASKYAKAFAKGAVVVGSEDDPKVYDGKWFDVWICPDLESGAIAHRQGPNEG